jgi:DNA-binding SARP family transcriptional activator
VTQAELAEALWPESLPASWTLALSAIVSRLRSRLASVGLPRSRIIGNAFGCYQFTPPGETWVDVEAALAGIDAAEGAIVAADPGAAYGPSLLASSLVRAIDTRVDALVAHNELELALTHAREAVRLEPYRESGYRRLMRMLAARGDRAEAVRVFNQCRDLLQKELGVAPSAETEALHREIAGSSRPSP